MAVVVLMGLPASGKTHFADSLKARLSSIVHVQYDQFIPSDCKGTEWKQCREVINDATELILSRITEKEHSVTEQTVKVNDREISARSVFQELDPAVNKETIVIVDDNMYYRSMRYEYYQLARKYGVGFCTFHLSCPADVCVKRNSLRTNPVPEDTILKMASLLEEPQPMKNQWEAMSFAISSEIIHMDTVLEVIKSATLNPVQNVDDSAERAQDRETCSKSFMHRTDQALRKMVAKGMIEATQPKAESSEGNPGSSKSVPESADTAALAQQLNSTRQEILAAIRGGEILLPPKLSEDVKNDSAETDEKLDEFITKLFYIKIEAKRQ